MRPRVRAYVALNASHAIASETPRNHSSRDISLVVLAANENGYAIPERFALTEQLIFTATAQCHGSLKAVTKFRAMANRVTALAVGQWRLMCHGTACQTQHSQ